MPTICHGPLTLSMSMMIDRPTASPLGKKWLASVWLMMATFWLFALSASLKGRPATIDIPAVSKYRPETRLRTECRFSLGAGVYPGMVTLEDQVPPLIGGVALR